MGEITKCTGINCKVKESCNRFLDKPNEFRQSYFTKPPLDENGDCDMYCGVSQESIFNYLKEITNGKSND